MGAAWSITPLLGRDEMTFLLSMLNLTQRQGWSELPGQRQPRGSPLPKAGPFDTETGGQTPCRGP